MKLARNSILVAAGAGLSRILGFLRDMMMAALLGSGPLADAFVVAFRLPNLFRRLLAEGAMNGAFVPIYGRAKTSGDEVARAFAGQVLTAASVAFVVIVALGEWQMEAIVALLAPGFRDDPAQMAQTVLFARLCFPFLLLSALTSVFGAVMNSEGRFKLAVYGPIAFNLVLISAFAAIWFDGLAGQPQAGIWLSIAVVLAGAAQLVLTYATLRSTGLAFPLRRPRWTPHVSRFAWMIGPALFVGGISHINAFVGTIVGSASESVISWLYYADRVYQLPLSIVGVAIGIVVLPDLTRRLAEGDQDGAQHLQREALHMGLALAAPAAVALFMLAGPIVDVLFRRGLFSSGDALATAQILAVYAIGLPGYIAAKALQPAFFARHDMRIPLTAALAGAAADIGLAVALFSSLQHVGIALAASAAGWINACILAAVLLARGNLKMDATFLMRLLRIAVATCGMALALAAALAWSAGAFVPGQGIGSRAGILTLLCLGGLAVYLALAQILGTLDVPALLRRLRGPNA